ncbi:hypothetical protein BW723_01655 [Polaribacter reichenbachii]|uniref:DUF5723 domain-containing protein n=1 Tax=Polaribacter reichenbachii TaxID=996801 RepID=A0A1B8TW82_9FLAO|nr:DUF5723 family protein [Polaribacter reichenbachii]APZ45077.1 hypothetical protein BW723_01655 [Polaribacter reichenbachii]AUC18939.1 hypothetical protein BTO17_09655 [Polaribacter reichenbachii]OBY63903.1 hypothetical protein LPB301_14045 [Polaribacter reichenbachii]
MKKIIFLLFIVWLQKTVAQNRQILYNFAELPQTQLLNPAAETNYKFYVGIPLLSGFSTDVGSTGLVLTDLFAKDNIDINDKISAAFSKLSTEDFVKINTQIEVFSGGYRLNDKINFSFGFYEEVDGIGYFAKDVYDLYSEGNSAHLNRSFSVSKIRYKLDVLGVLHFGVSKKIDEKLTIGGRFKIYSSALNVESNNNTGTFTTIEGENNLYTHYFNNLNANFRTSGLVNAETNKYNRDAAEYVKNTFLAGNLGLGFDAGFTYRVSPQLEFSGSILDVGFISHSKNVKTTIVNGDFVFEGINFLFGEDNINYWNEIDERFDEELPREDNQETYISWRPTKINAAVKYSFGEKRSKVCYDNRYKDFYTDAIGVQLFSVFRPLRPQLALTAFYEKSLSNKIHTKFTYTIDDISFANLGAGLSMQFGKVNFYGMFDNILSYKNLSSANSVSLQLGINLIFN